MGFIRQTPTANSRAVHHYVFICSVIKNATLCTFIIFLYFSLKAILFSLYFLTNCNFYYTFVCTSMFIVRMCVYCLKHSSFMRWFVMFVLCFGFFFFLATLLQHLLELLLRFNG